MIIVALPAGDSRQEDYTPNFLSTRKSNKKGSADVFSRFLKGELIPYIDKNFRTENYRIISGHSRGGLFVIDDLIDNTGLFQAHFAFSPALWVDNYLIADKINKNKSLNVICIHSHCCTDYYLP